MTKHGTVLLVEDDADDVLRIKKAFADAELVYPLTTVNSCKDAVAYFSGDGVYANRDSFPLPFLVLLNLKLAREEGFAVLRWLYERPGLRKKFPVVVWSAGDPAQDIQLAYELGAQSCLVKPIDHQQLRTVVQRVKDYWIELNLLPGDLL
jgi:CheY-like chemotaxis protein